MTDRGRVFVTLGRPDQIFEPNVADLSQRGRTQIWDYREHRLQILFIDQTGFGRWRMTPTSELEFEGVMRRVFANNNGSRSHCGYSSGPETRAAVFFVTPAEHRGLRSSRPGSPL